MHMITATSGTPGHALLGMLSGHLATAARLAATASLVLSVVLAGLTVRQSAGLRKLEIREAALQRSLHAVAELAAPEAPQSRPRLTVIDGGGDGRGRAS
jgi:hypothetical protein